MTDWVWNTYDTLKDAKTAVEAIADTTRIVVFGFKEGAFQKTVVLTGGTY
jgi:hypothetical protein